MLEKIDSSSRFIKYYNVIELNEVGVAVCQEELMDMKDSLRFLKNLKEHFHQLKSKGKWSRQYVKCCLLYNIQIEDIKETLKEEFSKTKLHMKL